MKHLILSIFVSLLVTACGDNLSSNIATHISNTPNTTTTQIETPNSLEHLTQDYEGTDGYGVKVHNEAATANGDTFYFSMNIRNLFGATYSDPFSADTSARQGGHVVLRHERGGKIIKTQVFDTGDNSRDQAYPNRWFSFAQNTKRGWVGLFQGEEGATLVIIDSFFNAGDGGGEELVSGTVYHRFFRQDLPVCPAGTDAFENSGFSTADVQQADGNLDALRPTCIAAKPPILKCWEVTRGPYDCRFLANENTSFSESNINEEAFHVRSGDGGHNPSAWKKIGRFVNLSKTKAFNEVSQNSTFNSNF